MSREWRVNDERKRVEIRRRGERPGSYGVIVICGDLVVEALDSDTLTEAYCSVIEKLVEELYSPQF